MNFRVRIKFVFASSGNSYSEEYYPSSIEELNSLIQHFNDYVEYGLYRGYKVVYVKEDN